MNWAGRVLRSSWDLAILGALGAAMLATNQWFTAVDDEVAIIDHAAETTLTTLHLFLNGVGQHEHPPLYDIFLHGWLRLTSGNIHLLRLPSTIFYLAGIWVLARVAKDLAGEKAHAATLIVAVLSPFGFHFGRLAAWYSFCFMLVSLETLLYLKYSSQRNPRTWAPLFLCSVALVYSNYFGWALLALLAVDFVITNWKSRARVFLPVVAMGVLTAAAFLPIAVAFLSELHNHVRPYRRPLVTVLNCIYVLYSMLVSESVAPWFWKLGVPAAMAIAVALILTVSFSPATGRRLLLYFLAALSGMAIIGVLETKRVLMIATWLYLPIGLALGSTSVRIGRRTLCGCLVTIFAIGWFGIFDRKLYAAPHWVEPWNGVAREAADVVGRGGITIANNQSFFFYLTYLLPPDLPVPKYEFRGLLPESTRRHGVFDPQQWLAAAPSGDRPLASEVLLIKGLHFGTPQEPTDETEDWLSENCHLMADRRMVPDIGAQLKVKYGPVNDQEPWRVEVLSYNCR